MRARFWPSIFAKQGNWRGCARVRAIGIRSHRGPYGRLAEEVNRARYFVGPITPPFGSGLSIDRLSRSSTSRAVRRRRRSGKPLALTGRDASTSYGGNTGIARRVAIVRSRLPPSTFRITWRAERMAGCTGCTGQVLENLAKIK